MLQMIKLILISDKDDPNKQKILFLNDGCIKWTIFDPMWKNNCPLSQPTNMNEYNFTSNTHTCLI